MEVVFRRTPGIMWDLSRIMVMKLNDPEKWMDMLAMSDHPEKDRIYVDYWLSVFGDPHRDITPIFYIRKPGMECYFDDMLRNLIVEKGEELAKEDLIGYLSDTKRIRKELCLYFLGKDVSGGDLESISEQISQNTDLEVSIRMQLLSLMINLEEDMQNFVRLFNAAYDQMQREYEKRANELLDWQEHLDIPAIAKHVDTTGGVKRRGRRRELRRMIVSFVLFSKWTMWQFTHDATWVVVGTEFKPYVPKTVKQPVNIEKIGNALADDNRIKIIESILEDGAQSCVELCDKLDIAINTVMYHMEILKQARILIYHHSNGKACYCVNTQILKDTRDTLYSWVRGDELIE